MGTQGLITRCRKTTDRRVVTTRLTDKGRLLLADLDTPLLELHQRQFAALDQAQLETLQGLLELTQA